MDGVNAVEDAPGISAATTSSGVHDAVAGLLMPLLLAAAFLESARRLMLHDIRPEQRPLAPPIPPPRLVSAIA